MLERPREEHRLRARHRLELGAVVAEADDDGAGVDALERLEEHVDALVPQELPEVDDGRRVAGQERGEPLRVALVGEALVRVVGVRGVLPSLGDEPGERLVATSRPPLCDVDSGWHLVHVVDVVADLTHDPPDVRRPDEDRRRTPENLVAPPLELGASAHRVLELRAVGLDGVLRTRRPADRATEQHVVAEQKVGGQPGGDRRRVRADPAIELLARAVLQKLHAVPVVAVEHEDREEPADVRPDDVRPAQVVSLRVRLLAEDGDVVAAPGPLAGELARVYVRSRSA
jgi:hypothetical protein